MKFLDFKTLEILFVNGHKTTEKSKYLSLKSKFKLEASCLSVSGSAGGRGQADGERTRTSAEIRRAADGEGVSAQQLTEILRNIRIISGLKHAPRSSYPTCSSFLVLTPVISPASLCWCCCVVTGCSEHAQ